MMTAGEDPFAKFKAMQSEAWGVFAPVEIFTTAAAAKLVKLTCPNVRFNSSLEVPTDAVFSSSRTTHFSACRCASQPWSA